jgi:hypothetical protein
VSAEVGWSRSARKPGESERGSIQVIEPRPFPVSATDLHRASCQKLLDRSTHRELDELTAAVEELPAIAWGC